MDINESKSRNIHRQLFSTKPQLPFPSDSQIPMAPTTESPKTFSRFGNDSYQLVAQKMNWDEARRRCQADDAELGSVLSPLAQAYMILLTSKHQEPLWIGLNSNVVKHGGST